MRTSCSSRCQPQHRLNGLRLDDTHRRRTEANRTLECGAVRKPCMNFTLHLLRCAVFTWSDFKPDWAKWNKVRPRSKQNLPGVLPESYLIACLPKSTGVFLRRVAVDDTEDYCIACIHLRGTNRLGSNIPWNCTLCFNSELPQATHFIVPRGEGTKAPSELVHQGQA